MQQGEGGARPGPPPSLGGPLLSQVSARRRLRKPTSVATATCEEGGGGAEGRRGLVCMRGGGGGGAVGRLAGARARGWGSGVPSRERHRPADRGGGAAGAGQSRPGSPGRPRRWGPRSAEGPAPRSAGTNPAEHHPRGRILVEAGGSATPSPRGRTGPGRAPPDGYRRGGRGWAPGLRGPGP